MPRRTLALLAVTTLAACGRAPRPTSTPTPAPAGGTAAGTTAGTTAGAPSRATQSGVASWYGPGFNGKRTANGEIYDQNAMTAAHKTLPLGTRVRVTNTQNERSVDVRINDRGPFVGNRIIDLSYAAARAIDMVGAGTAQVLIEILDAPTPVSSVPTALRFSVQIGSFTRRETAESLRDRATRVSRDVTVVTAVAGDTTYYRVRVGIFTDRAAAQAEAQRLRDAGFDALVVEN